MTDTCPECGAKVEQTGEKGRWRRFCSDQCRVVYNRKKRQEKNRQKRRPKHLCPNCGADFLPEWGLGQQRRFCSDECRTEWWKEYRKATPQEMEPERECVHCGQTYSRSIWEGGEYCSRECYLQAMAATHVTVVCKWCGEEFTALASSRRKYCSQGCSASAQQKVIVAKRGKRRISYTDPEEWLGQIKEATENAEGTGKRGKRVWLVCGATSMYTGIDGLLGVIRYRLGHNPFDGSIYVFCDGGGQMLKYLEWDGMGFCLGKRRAQSGTYPWPPAEAGPVIEISEKEFEFLRCKSIVPFRTKKVPRKRRENADIH